MSQEASLQSAASSLQGTRSPVDLDQAKGNLKTVGQDALTRESKGGSFLEIGLDAVIKALKKTPARQVKEWAAAHGFSLEELKKAIEQRAQRIAKANAQSKSVLNDKITALDLQAAVEKLTLVESGIHKLAERTAVPEVLSSPSSLGGGRAKAPPPPPGGLQSKAPPPPPGGLQRKAPPPPPGGLQSKPSSALNRGGLVGGIKGVGKLKSAQASAEAEPRVEKMNLMDELKGARGKTAGRRVTLSPEELKLESLIQAEREANQLLVTLVQSSPKKGESNYDKSMEEIRRLKQVLEKTQTSILQQKSELAEKAKKLAPKKSATPVSAPAPRKPLRERVKEENEKFQLEIDKLERDLNALKLEAAKHANEKSYTPSARIAEIPKDIESLRKQILSNKSALAKAEEWEQEKAARAAKALGISTSATAGSKAPLLSKEEQVQQLALNLGKAASLLDVFGSADQKLRLASATVVVKLGDRSTAEEREPLVKWLMSLSEEEIELAKKDLLLRQAHDRFTQLKDKAYLERLKTNKASFGAEDNQAGKKFAPRRGLSQNDDDKKK